jgi:hypothetical protein
LITSSRLPGCQGMSTTALKAPRNYGTAAADVSKADIKTDP